MIYFIHMFLSENDIPVYACQLYNPCIGTLRAYYVRSCLHRVRRSGGSEVCTKKFMAAALNEVHPFMRHTSLCADDDYLPKLE